MYAGTDPPVATITGSSPGSVKVVLNIYSYNSSNIDYGDTRELLSSALVDLAENSQGFLDSSSITVESTGKCDLFGVL